MEKTPYVHLYTDELEALPFLARGSNAVVFHAIGLLLPTYEDGPDADTIANYTSLTERTVRATLGLLIHSGLIAETSDGKYIPVKYIEYRKAARVARDSTDQSINHQSNQNQSSSSKLYTEDDFTQSYQALAGMLLLSGGINAMDAEKFKTLWAEHPDAELHKRAVAITLAKATRPNYRYYETVVRSGAIEYPAKTEKGKRAKDDAPLLEIQL